MARSIPLDFSSGNDMSVDVDSYAAGREEIVVPYNQVGHVSFATMAFRSCAGDRSTRAIARASRASGSNETVTRRYWSGRDPVGGTIRFGSGPVTIVGVAKDGKYQRLNEAPRNQLYLPVAQNYRPDMVLHVHGGRPGHRGAVGAGGAARARCDVPLFDVRTVEDHLGISTFIRGSRRRCSGSSARSVCCSRRSAFTAS